MGIEFEMPHVFVPGSDPLDNARALQVLLHCLVELNCAYLADHSAPSLYRSGVVYGRTTEWDTIPALYARQYGDCKSLSAALVAERRKAGLFAVPVFRWIRNKYQGHDYHILVMTRPAGAGRPPVWEDPSKRLGMILPENSYFQNGNGQQANGTNGTNG